MKYFFWSEIKLEYIGKFQILLQDESHPQLAT